MHHSVGHSTGHNICTYTLTPLPLPLPVLPWPWWVGPSLWSWTSPPQGWTPTPAGPPGTSSPSTRRGGPSCSPHTSCEEGRETASTSGGVWGTYVGEVTVMHNIKLINAIKLVQSSHAEHTLSVCMSACSLLSVPPPLPLAPPLTASLLQGRG